jgi:hypothetical protein
MPDPHLRASDADRSAVADVLGGSMSTGRLTVAEYDDRLARAYAARTYGELAELTADLPPGRRPGETALAPQPVAGSTGQGGPTWAQSWTAGCGPWMGGSGMRAAWASWLSTAVLVVGIWAVTSIASASWIYPWPVWVIGPWGVVLLSRSLGGPGRRGNPGRQRDRGRRHV